MPAMYAHLKFGHLVREVLPEEIKKTATAERGFFDLGLHGPDMFFYYRPWLPGRVSRTAHDIHYAPAYVFFEQSASLSQALHPPARAWLYGFVCHYALDHACHTYVQAKTDASGIAHMTIEAEFEKYLMMKDERPLDPDVYTMHLKADDYFARTITPFFPGLTAAEVRRSIKSFIRISAFLMFPPAPVRGIADLAAKALGKRSFGGLVTFADLREDCTDSDRKLEELLYAAVPQAVSLIKTYRDYIDGRTTALGDGFSHTFEAER